jgi:hypothetical protein
MKEDTSSIPMQDTGLSRLCLASVIPLRVGCSMIEAHKYGLVSGQSGFPASFLDFAALHRGYGKPAL